MSSRSSPRRGWSSCACSAARGYWPYGVEQVAAVCRAGGIAARPAARRRPARPGARRLSTLPPEACHRLWQYLVQGGPANARNFLAYAASLLGRDEPWQEPAPLLRAGLYWPGLERPTLGGAAARWRADAPGGGPRLLPGAGPGRQPRRDRRADRGAGAARPQPAAGLHRQPEGPGRGRPRAPPARRGARRRSSSTPPASPSPAPARRRATPFDGAGRRCCRWCSRAAARRPGAEGTSGLVAARHRDERGAARGRRPHPVARRLVQGRASASTRRPRATSSASRRSPTASPSSPTRRRLGAAAPQARRRAARRPRARQLSRTATAASATASGSTRRPARSRLLRALAGGRLPVGDLPADGAALIAGSLPGRPTPGKRGGASRSACRFRSTTYLRFFEELPQRCATR